MIRPTRALAHHRILSTVITLLVILCTRASLAATTLPSTTSISPAGAYTGQAGFNLVITGSGFSGQDRVEWNGATALSATYVSPTQIDGFVTASLLGTPGEQSVTVVNATGNVSNSQTFTVIAAPVISGLQPATVIAGTAAITLTVTGSNFVGNSTVCWKGAPLATSVVSPSELKALVPAADFAAAGTATVCVTSATAPSTGNEVFTIGAAPVVQIIKPSAILAGSTAFTLSVTGANFTPDENVTWNGSVLPTTDVSPTQLSASVPASLVATAGTANVGAITGGGVATPKPLPFTVQPDPSISSVSPTTAVANAPGFTLTVNGANFVAGYVVNWNGVGISTTYVSPTELSAHVATANIPSPGAIAVTVETPTNIVSNSSAFSITGGPVLSSVQASSCIAGVPSFTVTLSGSNFTKDAVATWNRSPIATTWVSPSQLTATITAAQVATPQAANIAVMSGSAPTTASVPFSVGLDPIMSNIVPTGALANSGSFTLTVNGGQFSNGYTVDWNGAALATTFVSANQLTAVVPATDIASAGTANIAVSTHGGITSGTATFTINSGAAISNVSPANVPAGTPGQTITINGSNFTGSCTALWNGSTINTVYDSPTQLSAYAPAALMIAPGTATLMVTLRGVNSNTVTFKIDSLPTLASMSPNSVNQNGPAVNTTVSGANFVPGSIVQWNGVNLTTTFVSATTLSAVIPASDTANAGIGQVTVQNPDSAVSSALPFRVLVVSNSPLWNQRIVWGHQIMSWTYSLPTSGPGIYKEIYPLDMASLAPNQSPATDIQIAQSEGLDGFAVEVVLNGSAAEPVLAAADAASPKFYVAPSLDLSTTVGETPAAIENKVVSAVENYAYDAATHPSAARDNGSLVIWTFDTSQLPNANWIDALNRIAAAGIKTTWIADIDGLFAGVQSFPQTAISNYLDIFQAGYLWSGMRDTYWDQSVSLFQELGHNFAGSVRAGSISPTQYYDAECTAMMRMRWQRNIDNMDATQWAIASTWNDFRESSGVNPTSTWNMVRPDLTAFYAAEFKGQSAPNPNAELYVTSPQAINLGQTTTAEAMIINPTNATVTADIQLYDGNGVQIGADVVQTVAPNSVDAATVPIDLVRAPAGGFFRANAIMYDTTGDILQTVLGAPTIVYPAGAVSNVNVVYYSIPAYNALAGIVGLTLTPNGVTGQATATVIPPAGTNVKFAEVLYNTLESEQFFNTTPTSETVSTAGPGFYVARVIDQNHHVGYSNPIYVGP